MQGERAVLQSTFEVKRFLWDTEPLCGPSAPRAIPRQVDALRRFLAFAALIPHQIPVNAGLRESLVLHVHDDVSPAHYDAAVAE